jgi:prolipoprotein diacylglyceryltransferase
MHHLLQSIPSPQISFFTIGVFKIHFYALCILAGIIAAIWISDRRLVARGAKSGLALDIALWTVPIAVIGARAFHVISHSSDYFYPGADLTAVFRIWEGGIAIYGGLNRPLGQLLQPGTLRQANHLALGAGNQPR